MKLYVLIISSLFIVGCSSSQRTGDFRSASEIAKDEKKGNVFGKDRLGWRWQKDEDEKSDAASQDPTWTAANIVLSQYPVSFSNFSAKIVQTNWINASNDDKKRYRITVRLLGKAPEKENIEVLVFFEQLNNQVWEKATGNNDVKNEIAEKILHHAVQIFDRQKKD